MTEWKFKKDAEQVCSSDFWYDLTDGGYINETLKRKIIAIKDVSYTGDFGVQELVERSEDVLAEEGIIKEKHLMKEFFEMLAKASEKAAYGYDDVVRLINMGAVEKVLISEDMDENKVDEIEKIAEPRGTSVEIISVETREGVQLRDMGMIAAVLRYAAE